MTSELTPYSSPFREERGRFFLLQALFVIVFACSPVAHASERFLDIEEVTSPGGVTAWLVQDETVPVIAMEFAFKGAGAAQDPQGKQGLVRLLSNTMDEGAGELDSAAFQEALREDAISLSFGSSRDSFSGSLKTLKENRARAFELMALALNEPRFDEEPLERMKQANLARIRSSLANPEWQAARLLNAAAYEGHPYARNSGGTLSSIPAITVADLRGYAQTHLTKDRLYVAVTGDITSEELAPLLDQVFGQLPESAPAGGIEDIAVQNPGTVTLYERVDIPQTVIEAVQPGVARDHPDYYAALVMNYILGGGGFGSRLMEEAREKRGLTYGIYTSLYNLDHVKTISLGTSTQNGAAGEMLEIIRAEFAKMREIPVTEQELADAKSYLIGSMPLQLTSTDRIARLQLSLQLDGLPIDYLDARDEKIAAVSADDILRLSRELLQPEGLTIVLVGRPEGVEATETVTELPDVE